MVKFMNKIPAGTFLVPMLLSALVYTIWPNLFDNIGGITDAFLGGNGTNFIIGLICFCSGISINVQMLGKLFKRHGILLIVKLILTIGFSLLFMTFFGQSGIFGISALAVTVAICSINPALYISLVTDFGDEVDVAAFDLVGLFGIPAVPMFIYALSGQGQIEWMPIISTILPLVLGMILGNLDKDFLNIFGKGIVVLLPILGWNIGQSLNLIEGLQSGIYGIVLVLIFYIAMSPLVIVDKKVLRNDGVAALSMNAVAGVSASFPAVIAAANPEVVPYVSSVTAQIITMSIITSIVTPILVRKLYQKNHKIEGK